MKKTLFLIFITMLSFGADGQPVKWQVQLGKKNIRFWPIVSENEVNSTIHLERSLFSKKGDLFLSHAIAADEKDWIRTLLINDSTGAGIIELPEVKLSEKTKALMVYKIPNKKLKEMAHHSKISISFTSIPSDPAKAALVRVRPVYICTILFIE